MVAFTLAWLLLHIKQKHYGPDTLQGWGQRNESWWGTANNGIVFLLIALLLR